MLYLLRLLIACLALASGGRVAEASAERGAASVTIEAPRHREPRFRPSPSTQLRAAAPALHSVRRSRVLHAPLLRAFERLRTGASAAPLFLLHRALLR